MQLTRKESPAPSVTQRMWWKGKASLEQSQKKKKIKWGTYTVFIQEREFGNGLKAWDHRLKFSTFLSQTRNCIKYFVSKKKRFFFAPRKIRPSVHHSMTWSTGRTEKSEASHGFSAAAQTQTKWSRVAGETVRFPGGIKTSGPHLSWKEGTGYRECLQGWVFPPQQHQVSEKNIISSKISFTAK